MVCSTSSRYKYESRGHVLTGDLSIIKDFKLINLIRKGPAYREQNNIDWRVNLKNCKATVSRCAKKWAREANGDRRVLEPGKKQNSVRMYIYIPYNPLVRRTSLLSAYSFVRHIVLSRMTHPLLGGCTL